MENSGCALHVPSHASLRLCSQKSVLHPVDIVTDACDAIVASPANERLQRGLVKHAPGGTMGRAYQQGAQMRSLLVDLVHCPEKPIRAQTTMIARIGLHTDDIFPRKVRQRRIAKPGGERQQHVPIRHLQQGVEQRVPLGTYHDAIAHERNQTFAGQVGRDGLTERQITSDGRVASVGCGLRACRFEQGMWGERYHTKAEMKHLATGSPAAGDRFMDGKHGREKKVLRD